MGEDENTVYVNNIVQSLSFEVEAIPQDNVLQLTSTPNNTPLNVKIKVRKKPNAGYMQHAVISLPKYSLPRKKTQNKRVRLISSDQTIMSFNMFMESDDQMVSPKVGKTFFGRLKSGGCLEPSVTDDKYSYAPSASTFAINKSQIHTIIADESPQNSEGAKHKKAVCLTKCKPGGCLDPPFGEDKHPYMPAKPKPPDSIKTTVLKTEMLRQGNISVSRSRSPSLQSMSPKRSFYTTTEQKPSDLSIYTPEPYKNELGNKYSHSIITYPPAVTPSEIEIFNSTREKKMLSITSVTDQTRKSFGQSSETYFSRKKQSFEETTNKQDLLKHALLDIQVSADNLNSDNKILLETKSKKVSITKEKTSISKKVPKIEGTAQVKLEDISPTSSVLQSCKNEIDKTKSTPEKQNISKELNIKELEPFQLHFESNKPTEVLTNTSLSREMTESKQHETNLNITDLIKEMVKDKSGFTTEKNNRKSSLSDSMGKSRNTSITLKNESERKQSESRNKSLSKSPNKSTEIERKTLSSILQTRGTSIDSEKSVRTGVKSAKSPSRKLSGANKLTKTETVNEHIIKKPPIDPATAAMIQDSFLLGDDGSKSPLTTSNSCNNSSYEKKYIEIETEIIQAPRTRDDVLENQSRTGSFITRENTQDIADTSVTENLKTSDKRNSDDDKENKGYSNRKSDIEFDMTKQNVFEVQEVISEPHDIYEKEIETRNKSDSQTIVLNKIAQDEKTAVENQETSGNIAKDIAVISPLLPKIVGNNISTQLVPPVTTELNKTHTSHDDVSIKSDTKIDFKKIDKVQTTDERNFLSNEDTIPKEQQTILIPENVDVKSKNLHNKQDLQMTNADSIANKQSLKLTIPKITNLQEDSLDTECKELPALPLEVSFDSSEKMKESQSKAQAEYKSSFAEIYNLDPYDFETKSDMITPKIGSDVIGQTEVLLDATHSNITDLDDAKAISPDDSRHETQDLWRNEGQMNIFSRDTSEFDTTSNAKEQSFDASFLSIVNESIIQYKVSPIERVEENMEVHEETGASHSHEFAFASPTTQKDPNAFTDKRQDTENTFVLIGDKAASQQIAAHFYKQPDDRHTITLQSKTNESELPKEYTRMSDVNIPKISVSVKQFEKVSLTDKQSILNAITAEPLSKISEINKGVIKETSLADYENNKYVNESAILLNQSSVQAEQYEKNSLTDKDTDKLSTLNSISAEADPEMSGIRKAIIKETSVVDFVNNKYNSEAKIVLNKLIIPSPMAGNTIKMGSENVSLDLALQSFLDKNNDLVIKSLDTASIPDKHTDKIVAIKSKIKTDDPGVTIPISFHHSLSIILNKRSFNDFGTAEDLGSKSVKILTAFGKPVEQASLSQKPLPKSGSKILDETLCSIYENQLVPLQNVIHNLKEEIDELAAQQDLMRERLLGLRRRKSVRFNVRKCSCWMK